VRFGGLTALDDVSIQVRAGQRVGLIGPNGAGKTTLFNVISGFIKPTAGTVTFDGQDISRLPTHRRAHVGIRRSFQNLGLMTDQTVGTNVAAGTHIHTPYRTLDPLARPRRWRRGERSIDERVTGQLIKSSLAPYRNQRVSDLSFGTARFVELATILVAEPRLLLLDEPTTGLDVHECNRLRKVLNSVQSEERATLVIAHDTAFVMEMCDWVYVLAGGRMLFMGPPEDVRTSDVVVDAYLGTGRR
jgi:branched-chain amino acid transport system ATP-binding protein